jgi:hypothetical protein
MRWSAANDDRSVKENTVDHQAVLTYLDDYVNNPQIVAYGGLPDSEKRNLPATWQNILSAQGAERVKRTLAQWDSYRPDFDDLPDFLKEHLLDVELIHHDGMYTLLYAVKSGESGKTLYYEARNPKTQKAPPAIAAVWSKFPVTFQRFYAEFHNGWYHLASHAMGPLPIEEIFPLSQEDWGILDDIGPQPIDLKSTYAFFANGMGTYISVELKGDQMQTLLWSSKEAPTYNLDFWPVLDSWTVIGLDE